MGNRPQAGPTIDQMPTKFENQQEQPEMPKQENEKYVQPMG